MALKVLISEIFQQFFLAFVRGKNVAVTLSRLSGLPRVYHSELRRQGRLVAMNSNGRSMTETRVRNELGVWEMVCLYVPSNSYDALPNLLEMLTQRVGEKGARGSS
jgi:hypothetical protein